MQRRTEAIHAVLNRARLHLRQDVGRLREVAAAAGLVVTGDAFGIFHAPVTDDSDGPLGSHCRSTVWPTSTTSSAATGCRADW